MRARLTLQREPRCGRSASSAGTLDGDSHTAHCRRSARVPDSKGSTQRDRFRSASRAHVAAQLRRGLGLVRHDREHHAEESICSTWGSYRLTCLIMPDRRPDRGAARCHACSGMPDRSPVRRQRGLLSEILGRIKSIDAPVVDDPAVRWTSTRHHRQSYRGDANSSRPTLAREFKLRGSVLDPATSCRDSTVLKPSIL